MSNGIYDYVDDVKERLAEKDNRIAQLENQLKNAIVPKFKKGQEVYAIFDKTSWGERTLELVNAKIIGIIATNKIQYMFSNLADWYIEENIFSTKEEAQARLEELKGEKNE